jgi:ribosomal 50S subunit-associated protein YjgA (DUF615 family)
MTESLGRDPMGEERGLKSEARIALRNALAKLREEERAKGNLLEVEEEFVDQVLDVAWKHQFDENPAAFRRAIRALLRTLEEEA